MDRIVSQGDILRLLRLVPWIIHIILRPGWKIVCLCRGFMSYSYGFLMGPCCGRYSRMRNTEEKQTMGKEKKPETRDGCENCKSFQEQFDKLEEEYKTHDRESEREIEDLKREIWRLKESSDKLTERMAKRLDDQNTFENASNPLCSTKLAAKFKSIKDKEFETFGEALDELIKDEVEVIQKTTELMEAANKACCEKADQQIRTFLLLDDSEKIPTRQEIPDLYRMRCKASANETKKVRVVQEIVHNVMKDVSLIKGDISLDSKTSEKLKQFLHRFTDCVWLMTIAENPLMLHFDVVNQPYTGQTAKHFSEYTAQGAIAGPVNTVMGVVWPSVTSCDDGNLCGKGEVLVSTTTSEKPSEPCASGDSTVNENAQETSIE